MIENEDGQVALAYYQPVPQVIMVGSTRYFFDTKRAVSLAWVNKEHVPNILGITKSCCGGRKTPAFRYATQSQVNVWLNIGR